MGLLQSIRIGYSTTGLLKTLFAFVLTSSTLLFSTPGAIAADKVNLHEISLEALSGETHKLDQFKGKVVVMNIWATWCAPCRVEMPELENLSTLTDQNKIKVIGITIDREAEKAKKFLADTAITFTNYIDNRQLVTRRILGIKGLPTTYIFNKEGKLIDQAMGPRKWDAPEIIQALENIYSGKAFDKLAFNPKK